MTGEPAGGESPGADLGDFGLFGEIGPLQSYPGPALIVGSNRVVLAANEAARPLVEVLTGGGDTELRAAIDDGLAGRTARVAPLVIEAGRLRCSGECQAIDLAVMPWGAGTAVLILGRDVTLERSLRQALIESRQRYKDLVEASHQFAWEVDSSGCFTFVSPRGALGFTASELIGRPAVDLLIEEEPVPGPFGTDRVMEEAEIWVGRADDEPACLLVSALPILDAQGRWQGVRGVASDITERRRQESEVAHSRNQERLLTYILGLIRTELEPARMLAAAATALVPALPAAGVAVFRVGEDAKVLPEPAVEAGVSIPELVATEALADLEGAEWGMELETKAGLLLVHRTAFDGQLNGALCLWRRPGDAPWSDDDRALVDELSEHLGMAIEQMSRQEALERESSIDPLTGLMNRRSFERQLEQRLLQAPGAWRDGVLFYVDLDNFKQVNDTFGHDRGDAALIAVSDLLKRFTRRQDLAARLGGDEFALFLVDIPEQAAVRKARTLVRAASQLRSYSPVEGPFLGFSIGLATTDPKRRESLASLMKRADEAMYQVKHGGKSGIGISSDRRRAEGQREDAA